MSKTANLIRELLPPRLTFGKAEDRTRKIEGLGFSVQNNTNN